jgi:hypothetical protein
VQTVPRSSYRLVYPHPGHIRCSRLAGKALHRRSSCCQTIAVLLLVLVKHRRASALLIAENGYPNEWPAGNYEAISTSLRAQLQSCCEGMRVDVKPPLRYSDNISPCHNTRILAGKNHRSHFLEGFSCLLGIEVIKSFSFGDA